MVGLVLFYILYIKRLHWHVDLTMHVFYRVICRSGIVVHVNLQQAFKISNVLCVSAIMG